MKKILSVTILFLICLSFTHAKSGNHLLKKETPVISANICLAIPNDYGKTMGWRNVIPSDKKLPEYGTVRATPDLVYCYLTKVCLDYSENHNLEDHVDYWMVEYADCLDDYGISKASKTMIKKTR